MQCTSLYLKETVQYHTLQSDFTSQPHSSEKSLQITKKLQEIACSTILLMEQFGRIFSSKKTSQTFLQKMRCNMILFTVKKYVLQNLTVVVPTLMLTIQSLMSDKIVVRFSEQTVHNLVLVTACLPYDISSVTIFRANIFQNGYATLLLSEMPP